MPKILLASGSSTTVDEGCYKLLIGKKLYELVNKKKNRSYVTSKQVINGKSKTAYLHRIIMEHHLGRKLESWEEIDHINGNPFDNRLSNLRVCTHGQNVMNRRDFFKGGRLKFLGVFHFPKSKHPWLAKVVINQKIMRMGMFETAEEAAYQRDLGAIKFHGDYASLNFEENRQEYINKIRSGYDPVHHPKFSSTYKGVSFFKKTGRWMARIVRNGKIIHVGCFGSEIEAKEARDTALKELA